MALSPVVEDAGTIGLPAWIEPSLRFTPGRDPLGFQTITTDRLMPALLPGVLALSRRARYFSFYPFLLLEYAEQRLPATNGALSDFVRAREFEYALAVQLCPRGCGGQASGASGKENAARALGREPDTIARGESVESYLGGYGLYYRSPLVDVGLVAPAGTPLGERPTTIDVLSDDRANPRAHALARAFRAAVAETRYYRRYMRGVEPIPRDVLVEYADRACLCRLTDYPDERQLLREALFSPTPTQDARDVDQRRRSFALLLALVGREPAVADSPAHFRRAIWGAFTQAQQATPAWSGTVAQWAAVVAKEYMQEAFSSIWADFCRLGLERQSPEGLAPDALDALLRRDMAGGGQLTLPGGRVLAYDTDTPTAALAEGFAAAAGDHALEALRGWVVEHPVAISGLALLLELYRRLPEATTAPSTWAVAGHARSDHQPGLLGFGRRLREHLATAPAIGETLAWLIRHHILTAHESLAYAKLPNFTFRFRWEHGCLRFYSFFPPARFDLTDMRHDAMARLSRDLGLCEEAGPAGTRLTAEGERFVREVLL
jgi:hypothetical protein